MYKHSPVKPGKDSYQYLHGLGKRHYSDVTYAQDF